MHAKKLALFTLLGSSVLVGCRSVDDPGSGGAGASDGDTGAGHPSGAGSGKSGSGSSGSGTAGSGIPDASGSTAAGGDPCDAFCTSVGACYDDCHQTCKSFQDPPCAAEGAELVSCLTAHYDSSSCTLADESCSDPVALLFNCQLRQPLDCGSAVCGGNDHSCSCTAECNGGERHLVCAYANGLSQCTCYVNGFAQIACGGPAGADPRQTCQLDQDSCCAF